MTKLIKCLSVFVRISNVLCIGLLIFLPSILYKYSKHLILISCHEKNETYFKNFLNLTETGDSGIESSTCYTYKIILFSFSIFNFVRIISFYYEKMVFKTMESCYMRRDYPCLHIGSMIGIPYIIYQLFYTHSLQYGGEFLFLYILTLLLIFTMYPYIKGFILLIKTISYCLKKKYFSHWFELYTTLVALFIYGTLILTLFLHLIFFIPSPITIYGYPLYYPYINFPLIMFFMHHHIIRSHKEVSPIIYKVIEEDFYLYAKRYKCINGSICLSESNIFILPTRPSTENNTTWNTLNCYRFKKDFYYNNNNFISNKAVANNVITVKNMEELDGWIIKKLKFYLPPKKIEVNEKYY
uniref:Post-GPI attachment to proteins factor 3 n=1 Tax=Strongyloides stercoralis TaxID=6248 RepID=A0A0K0E1A7_STRER